MANNYQFLDAYGSVLTAATSVVAGAHQPIVQIGSIVGGFPVSFSGSPSISGTVNVIGSIATLQGTNPWIIGNSSVMLTQGVNTIGSVATLQGTNPWIVQTTGSVISFSSGSIAAVQSGVWAVSVVGGPLNIGSILGTYAEDSGHTDGNAGVFTLGVRNDKTSSFVSANLDYTPHALDSAGRMITKPFAADHSSVFGTGSVNGAASVIVLAAPPTGLRNYVTDIWVANTGTAATLVRFTAGGASVLGYTIAPAGGGSNVIGLQSPIATPAGSPFNIAADTATSVLYGTAYGYVAP